MRHFGLTGRTRTLDGVTLHQIRALVDLEHHGVQAGDPGGWVQAPGNLRERAWIDRDAAVMHGAIVAGDTLVTDEAVVRGRARVNCSSIGDASIVTGLSQVIGTTIIGADANIASRVRLGLGSVVMGSVIIDRPITANNANITSNDHWRYQPGLGPDELDAGFARTHHGVCLFAGDTVCESVEDFENALDALVHSDWAGFDPGLAREWAGGYELLITRAKNALNRWSRS